MRDRGKKQAGEGIDKLQHSGEMRPGPGPGRSPGTQARPLWTLGGAGKASWGGPTQDWGGTDKQYLTIVLVLQLLHVSPPNS